MKPVITFLTALFIGAASAHAIILLPGKIEEPKRADRIISEKFKAKKAFLDKHRKRIKQKFVDLKNSKQNLAAVPPAPTPLREDATIRSKGVATDGTMVPEGRALQEAN